MPSRAAALRDLRRGRDCVFRVRDGGGLRRRYHFEQGPLPGVADPAARAV